MPATVIAERVGWERSIRVLRDRVAELRPLKVVWDQEGAIGQWRGPTMAFTDDFQSFRGTRDPRGVRLRPPALAP